jgi:hypothetical protein
LTAILLPVTLLLYNSRHKCTVKRNNENFQSALEQEGLVSMVAGASGG